MSNIFEMSKKYSICSVLELFYFGFLFIWIYLCVCCVNRYLCVKEKRDRDCWLVVIFNMKVNIGCNLVYVK